MDPCSRKHSIRALRGAVAGSFLPLKQRFYQEGTSALLVIIERPVGNCSGRARSIGLLLEKQNDTHQHHMRRRYGWFDISEDIVGKQEHEVGGTRKMPEEPLSTCNGNSSALTIME